MSQTIQIDKESREFIVWLFRGRCVECLDAGGEVNEIIPKSRGNDSLYWKNKVLMCHSCHENYHANGVSLTAIKALQEQRIKFLIAIGREEYI
jgi:5-methylcytosine-specific restriction endonuclease McrA